MTRREEIVNNIGYQITMAAMEFIENRPFPDAMDAFEAGAEWMQKTMIEKACEYAEARYDLDYCGNVRDVLNYLKSLMEE